MSGEFFAAQAWEGIGLLLLLLVSAFFSFSETVFFSLSQADLLRLREGRHRAGHIAASLMSQPRRLLMVLLLGNLLVNISFYAISARVVFDVQNTFALHWLLEASLFLLPALPVIFLGEVAPKMLAASAPARLVQVVALPVAGLVKVLWPIEAVLSVGIIEPLTRLVTPSRPIHQALSDEELAQAMELLRGRRLLAPNETAWLKEVIELRTLKVSDIMVPRVDVVSYEADDPPEGLIQLFRRTGLRKMPICRGGLDNTLGILFARDLLLSPDSALTDLARPTFYIPESATLDKLLHQFRRRQAQLAIVVDEYGGTAGLVTLEDAIEEIVGDIAELDEQISDPVRPVGNNEYLVSGDLGLYELTDVFGLTLPDENVSTVGGLMMSLLGRVPKVGDVAAWGRLQLRVEAMRRHRIALVRLWVGEGANNAR